VSKRIYRLHLIESAYVGPKEPNLTFPPGETLQMPERITEWSFEEVAAGIVITHRNPRALTREVSDGRGATKRVETPNGQVWQTLVPWANVRDVQYEDEVASVPVQQKMKGAA
jgi:hypothetical protein